MMPKTAGQNSGNRVSTMRGGGGTNTRRTNLNGNEGNDDLLEAFCMPARDGLLEELEHVLEDFHARVQEVDALRDLEVAAGGIIQRLQIGVGLCGRVCT